MAWFKNDKKEEKKETATPKAATPVSAATSSTKADLAHVLKNPRITEKATMHGAQGVYTFDIAENATKREIFAAVKKFYAVTPRMVRVVRVPAKMKRSMRTGKVGMKSGGKKAYVYLKKGEQITLT